MSDLMSYLPINSIFRKEAISEDEQQLLFKLWENKLSSVDPKNHKVQSLIEKGFIERTNLLGKFDLSKKGRNLIKVHILSNETSALEKKASLIKVASLQQNQSQQSNNWLIKYKNGNY